MVGPPMHWWTKPGHVAAASVFSQQSLSSPEGAATKTAQALPQRTKCTKLLPLIKAVLWYYHQGSQSTFPSATLGWGTGVGLSYAT